MDTLYQYRFDLLLLTQIFILFGGLFFPADWYESLVSPIFFSLNLFASLVLFSKNKKKLWLVVILLAIALFSLSIDVAHVENVEFLTALKLFSFFIVYALLTLELIFQVFYSKYVSKNVIFGLISGYISIGFISFFICLTIETYNPGAFQGLLLEGISEQGRTENLIYFSFITLMAIGYGEIVPVIPIAKKATIFIGLIGQFYLVILTAIIVGKYINQKTSENS